MKHLFLIIFTVWAVIGIGGYIYERSQNGRSFDVDVFIYKNYHIDVVYRYIAIEPASAFVKIFDSFIEDNCREPKLCIDPGAKKVRMTLFLIFFIALPFVGFGIDAVKNRRVQKRF